MANTSTMRFTNTKKFQFVCNDKFAELLDDLVRRSPAETKTEVIKNALKFYDWAITEAERGREVISRPHRSDVNEVSNYHVLDAVRR